jgi:selenocysteine lyase/cysteine desulfurase
VDVPVPGYANTGPLPRYWPTNTLLYGAENGVTILQGGQRNPDDNVAALLQLVGNGSRPSQKALFECCRLWDGWGRAAIEAYLVSLAWYLRARLAGIWGARSLSFPLAAGSHAGQIGLTSFNPFSPGYDYNADLTPAQATAQAQAAAQALSDLRNGFGIVVRTTTVPHTLRSDPSRAAVLGATASTPLRISTHLFHSTADVDRLVDALLSVVPHP